jgi:hypothetical protein
VSKKISLVSQTSEQTPEAGVYIFPQDRREQSKLELRRRIQEALQSAKDLSPDDCCHEVRVRLSAIREYCQTVKKTFIVVEERITCDQFGLGGVHEELATLFRGPSEDASVAICVTDRGSLLHRNDCPWQIYSDKGDIRSLQSSSRQLAD